MNMSIVDTTNSIMICENGWHMKKSMTELPTDAKKWVKIDRNCQEQTTLFSRMLSCPADFLTEDSGPKKLWQPSVYQFNNLSTHENQTSCPSNIHSK